MSYPYIPKKYYAAVMFACKMIRQHGYFNKACKKAADYYNVSTEVVEKHVKARQNAGKVNRKSAKYNYYTVCQVIATEEGSNRNKTNPIVVRATSEKNAGNTSKLKHGIDGNGGYYDLDCWVEVMGVYSSKKEAEENLLNDFEVAKHGEKSEEEHEKAFRTKEEVNDFFEGLINKYKK